MTGLEMRAQMIGKARGINTLGQGLRKQECSFLPCEILSSSLHLSTLLSLGSTLGLIFVLVIVKSFDHNLVQKLLIIISYSSRVKSLEFWFISSRLGQTRTYTRKRVFGPRGHLQLVSELQAR